ncbi:hypothetical protein BDA96_07G196900 [Sorghum bicolor]|uniref:Magnesium transporter n=2 Tax=Sorghum bicolor TaxID=4558 RepID=A0A921UB48_SORBI|nr:hypothetical protein BDA96_07G196900 [Sorghum bicolor]KXG25477.1 hypothetical protein SORBI_3007G185200 [Sorghum bicolor]
MATATATPPRRRHAATGAAAGEWAALSASGEWRAEAIGKHQLVRRTGLSARDLRALDPALSHPSSVMARDRAVVVNLDRVRAVITATEDGEVGKDGGVSPPSGGGGGKALPFEFRALEVCLEYACKSLEHETSMLEKEAYPALDALTSRISTLNLEHVRQIKCRLVAIAGGVHKVRDELEHLLDDDADMAAMHLSEKAAFQAASQSSRFDIGTELVEIDGEGDEDEAGTEQEEQGSMTFMPKIDELESLLEVYFVQIDGTLNKLSTLREYVDDTEDYINIMLDDKQNQLLQMGVVLSTVTLLVTSAVVVTAIFGMNIHIALYRITDLNVFWEAVGGTLAGVAMLFLGAMLYYWKNGILR